MPEHVKEKKKGKWYVDTTVQRTPFDTPPWHRCV